MQNAICCGLLLTVAACAAQAPPLEFEVASIKPSHPGADRPSFDILPGGRLDATGISLLRLILFAYDVAPNQISGTSGWMQSERYDIVAKPPEGAVTGAVGRQAELTRPNGATLSWTDLSADSEAGRRIREMLQALLAERFQLKVHRETKEASVYELVLAKSGPKFHPATNPDALKVSGRMGKLTFQGVPMSFLAIQLSRLTGRTVVDRTGLKGSYDFTMNWTPDEGERQMIRAAVRDRAKPAKSIDDDSSGPSVFAALQEELGLKLQAAKGSAELLVIDHAERPSPN